MRFLLGTMPTVALLASGCTTFEGALPGPERTDNCPVLESEGWQASVSPVPGNPSRSQLSVKGNVTMPTPGYTFGWEQGPLDRSAVPAFELRLITNAPSGMVAQMLEAREVSYFAPAAAVRYRAVTITCDGRVLGRIENVS